MPHCGHCIAHAVQSVPLTRTPPLSSSPGTACPLLPPRGQCWWRGPPRAPAARWRRALWSDQSRVGGRSKRSYSLHERAGCQKTSGGMCGFRPWAGPSKAPFAPVPHCTCNLSSTSNCRLLSIPLPCPPLLPPATWCPSFSTSSRQERTAGRRRSRSASNCCRSASLKGRSCGGGGKGEGVRGVRGRERAGARAPKGA